jgi:hypothetical protein
MSQKIALFITTGVRTSNPTRCVSMARLFIDTFEDSRSYVPRRPPRFATCFHTDILLGLFDPEDGDDMFLRKFGSLSTDYTALYSRR